jgi:PIN domain nuclease of toxin-antitoxin system
MKLLADTHLLIWAVSQPERLGAKGRAMIGNPEHQLYFSSTSIWEIAIKVGRGRGNLSLDISDFIGTLHKMGCIELAVTSRHAREVATLPHIHFDPFDRLLVAQTLVEGDLLLVTADATVAKYPAPIMLV